MILDERYFSHPRTYIAGIETRSDGVPAGNAPKLIADIRAYIDHYEPRFLRMLLGDCARIPEECFARRLRPLLAQPERGTSVIAKYVYFYYARDHDCDEPQLRNARGGRELHRQRTERGAARPETQSRFLNMKLTKVYIPAAQWGCKAADVLDQINECSATAATAVTVNINDPIGVGCKVDTFAVILGALTNDAMKWAIGVLLDAFEGCEVVKVK